MEEKVGFFKRLKNGLSKTRDSFVSGIDSLFTGFSEIDDDFYEDDEVISFSTKKEETASEDSDKTEESSTEE